MNRLITAIAVTATLFLSHGCSTSPKAEEKPAAVTKQHGGHSTEGTQQGEQPSTKPHGGHSTEGTQHGGHSTTTQAKLTVPKNITANTLVPLVIEVQDSAGGAIASFDTFQEKLMHLIVVSDDLQFFSHLHPTTQGNGRFEVEASFPSAGGYTLFSDYKPSGQPEQVSVMKTAVAGKPPTPEAVDLNNRTKTFGNTRVELQLHDPTITAGKEVMLMFNLQDAATNQPVKDLQPYLGEKGHLVIVQQSSSLTRANYIHAHAMKDSPEGHVHFMTHFTQPGKYKIWGQFNRNGKILTADFWVNVL